jgi:hypothetical protein
VAGAALPEDLLAFLGIALRLDGPCTTEEDTRNINRLDSWTAGAWRHGLPDLVTGGKKGDMARGDRELSEHKNMRDQIFSVAFMFRNAIE